MVELRSLTLDEAIWKLEEQIFNIKYLQEEIDSIHAKNEVLEQKLQAKDIALRVLQDTLLKIAQDHFRQELAANPPVYVINPGAIEIGRLDEMKERAAACPSPKDPPEAGKGVD